MWDFIDKLGGITAITQAVTPVAVGLLSAMLILVVGLWATGLVTRIMQRVMVASKVEKTVVSFLCKLVRSLLVVFVIVAVLSKLGVQTASLVALVGAMGLAVGLSLRSSLSNLASGILIVLFRPMRVGDYIEINSTKGTVEEINILFTQLTSPGNQALIVPNSKFMSDTITNYSRKKTRRNDFIIGVGYNDPLDQVKSVLEEIMQADKRILSMPAAPCVMVSELADSSVNLTARYWTASTDYLAVKCDLTEVVKARFDKEGFNIPYPQMDIHVNQVTP